MAFNWTDYLRVCDWLLQQTAVAPEPVPCEAAYRATISRAYYAAFHSALGLLEAKGEFTRSGEGTDHGSVINAFLRHSTESRRDIGTKLGRLRERRRRADYQNVPETPRGMAKLTVDDARQVIALLDKL